MHAMSFCHVGMGNACCTSKGLIPDRANIPGITRHSFADRPSMCEGICLAFPGCRAFSHSTSLKHCILCPDCSRHKHAPYGSYSSWRLVGANETFAKEVALAEPKKNRKLLRATTDVGPGALKSGDSGEGAGLCIAPRPCAGASTTVALVFRGETFRWGCDELGIEKQRRMIEAYQKMLIEPLEALGSCVHIFFVLDRGCPDRDGELERLAGDRLAFSRRVHTFSQPENVRSVLDIYLATASSKYDFTMLVRFDVQLLTPVTSWGCRVLDSSVMSFAAKCDPKMWNAFNCTSDLLYVVPRALLPAFSSQVGRHKDRVEGGPSEHCCFNIQCLGNGGHGCLNLMQPELDGRRVEFCWPRAVRKVSEWNANYLVPQCNDLPHGKAGSVWRCKLPELQGRVYNRTGGDLSMPPPRQRRGIRRNASSPLR